MRRITKSFASVALLEEEEPLKATLDMMKEDWIAGCDDEGLTIVSGPKVTYKKVVAPLGGTALLLEAFGEVRSVLHLCKVMKHRHSQRSIFQMSCACGIFGDGRLTESEAMADIEAHLAETEPGGDDAQEGQEAK